MSPTAVPFTSVPLGKTTFQITTSVGRSLQTYDLRRGLNLVFLSSPLCPGNITATCAYRDRVFVAWGKAQAKDRNGVWIFKRGRLVAELEQQQWSQTIEELLILGNWIVARSSSSIEVWKSETYEHHTSIHISTTTGRFTALCALPTFVNKVCLGRSDGAVDIYNISSGKLVHTISSSSSTLGAVTCLRAVPTVGLIAVAYANGALRIVDVETEEIVIDFTQSDNGKTITSITFRSDGEGAGEDGRSDGIMATASTESGDITLWDLNRGGKILSTLRAAHEVSSSSAVSGISGIEFLAGQPLIVSSGLDNALKTWIFDAVPFSPTPRLLHGRSGHAGPVSSLKFLPAATDGSEANGKWLLSAGNDRSLWGFSLRRDGQSTELSQGNVRHKAKKTGKMFTDETNVENFKCPPVTSIACSLNRDGGMGAVSGAVWANSSASNAEESNMTGWESVVTAHQNDKFARTWSWGRKRAGRWAFEASDHKPITSVAITACGTFALVGSAGGSLDMFNLQSGTHRQRFPAKHKPGQTKPPHVGTHKGHHDAITGIAVDNMNRTILSTSLDRQIIFWHFLTGQVQHRVILDAAPMAVTYNTVSGLISVACDDLCIRIVDIETRRVVRELWGCVGQIYDHCFSHDGRWIVACSMDSVVRVFDLSTGHLVDAFRTSTCTNVAFSSTGEFLATAHAGHIGINVWNNKSLFMQISLNQVNEEQDIVDLTNLAEFEATNPLKAVDVEDQNGPGELEIERTADQLHQSLLTLSLQPQSRWQTLLNLDTIRKRNKPVQPPQKPKAAPFFLGSSLTNDTASNVMKQDEHVVENEAQERQNSRIAQLSSFQPVQSVLATHLDTFKETLQSNDLAQHLMQLSPSAADLDIRGLTIQEMSIFVKALTIHLQRRRDFELINTWMSVFLRLHGDFVNGVKDIRNAVIGFQQAMQAEEARLSRSVGWARGVTEYLRSSR